MLRITVDGNAEHGWLAEVHDGAQAVTYEPDGADVWDALSNTLSRHRAPPTEPGEPKPDIA